MEMTVFWLLSVALAQSAIAMSVYFIRLRQPRPDSAVVDDFMGPGSLRARRSVGFGGFHDFASESKSWFPWGDGSSSGHVSSSSSDFSPPHFGSFGGGGKGKKKKSKSSSGGGKGSEGAVKERVHFLGTHCTCKRPNLGRAEPSLGPIFITKADVPESMKDKFHEPQEKSTAERRAKYDLNREFSTPPHAYRIVEEIPFFDTLDHKTVILTLENFRAENTIALHKLKSIRPFFPFFIKD
ncbi:hypothetical protein FHG87_007289 [Trinorchestia longiramus]|nr:hypothetical protein FHG87_007289 [Trinorchestia longiramus]